MRGIEGRERPDLAGEGLRVAAERCTQRHPVDVPARCGRRRVQVAVRIEPDRTARPVHRRHSAEGPERDRVVAAEDDRRAVLPDCTCDGAGDALAGLLDLGKEACRGSPLAVASATAVGTLPQSAQPIPSSPRRSSRSAYRIADGPMSTPRLPAPRSSAAPMTATFLPFRSATAREATLRCRGEVAQLVEHTAENRGVAGSIPALATRSVRSTLRMPRALRPASVAAMITGVHAVVFNGDAEATRAFFRDTLGLRYVDAGGGWLIFALSWEIAAHLTDERTHVELVPHVRRRPRGGPER